MAARLVSYNSVRDMENNRYTTFHNESSSTEMVQIHHAFKRMTPGDRSNGIASSTAATRKPRSCWHRIVRAAVQRTCCRQTTSSASHRKQSDVSQSRRRHTCCWCCCWCGSTRSMPKVVVSTRYRAPISAVDVHTASGQSTPSTALMLASSSMRRNSIVAPLAPSVSSAGATTTTSALPDAAATKRTKGGRYWNWDDSFRSNADRFLQTLEWDTDAEKSLRRAHSKRSHKLASVFRDEAHAAELGSSPLIGGRNGTASPAVDMATSPIRTPSRASSTETWPQQCDEDIDRLVAMHQNRSSLSSLGLRSDSMASVYSGAGEGRYGTVTVKGQVEFGMQYNYKQGALEIHVVQCKELAAVDTKRNRSDPYVKLYLLPDKSKTGKRKTKVKKHTLNPMFDETLRFHMSLSSLESRSLWLTVWHSDMFGRNDFLGEVTVNLQGRVFDSPQPQWYLLQERSEPFDDMTTYRGDIIVGLKFIPPESVTGSAKHLSSSSSAAIASGTSSGGSLSLRKFGSLKVSSSGRNASTKGSLHVLVKEGKNLQAVKANGSCDAFCKSYLLPDKNRSSKQKTPVVKRTSNPVWNYTFVYEDVSLNELAERALELTVWDHDRLSSNEFLGGVRFSLGTGKHYGKQVDWMDGNGREMALWQSMLSRPNFWVEGCVVMRSTLDGGGRFNA